MLMAFRRLRGADERLASSLHPIDAALGRGMQDDEPALPASPEVVERWVAAHRDFLKFLEPRVASRTVAEELLQNAFVRALERGGSIRDEESAVAWFYRLLRNALV